MKRKVCKDCAKTLSLSRFYRHASYRDGRMNTCKACKIAQVEANRELKWEAYYRERKRAWAARPEVIARRRAYAASPRGIEVMRAARRRYRQFRELERRA